jgi:flagellar biosynthesis/type III secretory pathway M-ring protein FliF/YscJ
MNVLGRAVASMSGIERATVLINEPRNLSGIGRANLPASAAVSVWTRGGQPLDQPRVDAIAALVAGGHAHLRVENVEIVDATSGRSHRARPPEARASTAALELQIVNENRVREKIGEALAYIPGVNVAVQVTVDARDVLEHRRQVDEPKLGPTQERTHRVDSSNQSGASEAGVRPNVGASLAAGGGRRGSLSDERSEASMIPMFGGTESRISDPRGQALQINATIGVPKSYFVRLFQDRRGGAEQPDEAELNAVVDAETARIKSQIEPLIDTSAVEGARAGAVFVSMIPDFALVRGFAAPGGLPAGGALAGEGGMIATALSEGAAGYVGLGVLAAISLAMMFMMVRRASVREHLPTAAELVGAPPTLSGDENELVGEATETTPSLVGLEIDEDQLRRQQMLDQINEMAREAPTEAATLIRRWVKAEV